MEVAGRLVGQDHLRLCDHGARHADQLLLSARELVRVEVLFADDLKFVQDVSDDPLPVRFLDVAVGERDFEVFVNRQMVQQVVALKTKPMFLLRASARCFALILWIGCSIK